MRLKNRAIDPASDFRDDGGFRIVRHKNDGLPGWSNGKWSVRRWYREVTPLQFIMVMIIIIPMTMLSALFGTIVAFAMLAAH